jgi:hypothetical protein
MLPPGSFCFMAKRQAAGEGPMLERFFIRATLDTKKRLAHAAIDLDSSSEKLAGELLRLALDKLLPDMLAAHDKARRK